MNNIYVCMCICKESWHNSAKSYGYVRGYLYVFSYRYVLFSKFSYKIIKSKKK